MNAGSFPYLIIGDTNYRPGSTELVQRSRGYFGWQHPSVHREFRGPRPVTNLIPRSQWTSLIRAGQGTFLSDLVKQRGIQAKNQNGLNYCWVYGSTRTAELWRILGGMPGSNFRRKASAVPATVPAQHGRLRLRGLRSALNITAPARRASWTRRTACGRGSGRGWQKNALTTNGPTGTTWKPRTSGRSSTS